jgi:hypothetical protein
MPHVEQIRDGEVPAALAATYVELRRVFGASEAPDLFRALAPIPSALATSWRALGPNVRTAAFERHVKALHGRAVRASVDLGTPLLEPLLLSVGLDVDALDALRDEVRLLEACETRAWLFSAGLRRWLAGERLTGHHGLSTALAGEHVATQARSSGGRHPGGVAAELSARLSGLLHLPGPTRLVDALARSEPVFAAVLEGLEPVLQHRAFGEAVTRLGHDARLRWDRMPLDVAPFESDVAPADLARWRHVAALFEEAQTRHGLFSAALRVGLDGAEDALVTASDDESLH